LRWLLVLLLLAGCGGGGGSSSAPAIPGNPVPVTRYFGYFGSDDKSLAETVDHVNLFFAADWNDHLELPTQLNEARAHGVKVVLHVERYIYVGGRYIGSVEAVKALLDQISKLGQLDLIVALYPIDEPDMQAVPVDFVLKANSDLRALFADYPGLGGTALAVIYGDHGTPGIDSYDWIGKDHYGSGVITLPVTPSQRVLIVPGGADPWREDPSAFINYVDGHPEVVAVLAFTWIDNYAFSGYRGIRSNGLAPVYCSAAKKLTGKGNCA
jgi:hypothetical protein